MAGYKLLKRLEAIIEIVQRSPNISKNEIMEKLSNYYGIDTTTRTLERDFKALVEEFGIEMSYQKEINGYRIDNENQKRIESLIKFIELIHMGELFKEGLSDFDLLQNKIELEDASKFKGIEHLKTILLAIKKNKEISFVHENYYAKTEKDYSITPLKIKEYLNRWYVIGVPNGSSEIRTFGLDRIEKLTVKKVSKIERSNFENQLEKFNHIVGINFGEAEKPEKVLLRVDDRQLKYLESLPLHHSQKIEIEEEESYGFATYYIIPNYEFKIQVLKMGEMAEVLEPIWLRDDIKDMLERSLSNYQI